MTDIKPGTKLWAVHAPEAGIPITEGEVYTVRRYAEKGCTLSEEGCAGINDNEPGVTLREVAGLFMLRRFEVAA